MTAFTIYMLGVGIGTAIGVALGWRKGMPVITSQRRGRLLPDDALELVATMLCFALAWPYLLGSLLLTRRKRDRTSQQSRRNPGGT